MPRLLQVTMALPGVRKVPGCLSLGLSALVTPQMPATTSVYSTPRSESPGGPGAHTEWPKAGCPLHGAVAWRESCCAPKKPSNFTANRGEMSQGACRVLAMDKGWVPHAVLTTTLGVGLNITYTPQEGN